MHSRIVAPTDTGPLPDLLTEFASQAELLADHNALARFRLSVNAEPLADAIGFSQWLSGRLQVHTVGRAALIEAQREAIDELIRTLYRVDLRLAQRIQIAAGDRQEPRSGAACGA